MKTKASPHPKDSFLFNAIFRLEGGGRPAIVLNDLSDHIPQTTEK